jgi:uncharacterized protein (DUF58 family)
VADVSGPADPPSQLSDSNVRRVRLRWDLSAHARRLLTLALAGLIVAILTRRPEFAGLAAPAVLLLATWRTDRPDEVSVRVSLTETNIVEGTESAVRAELGGLGEFDAELTIEAAEDVDAGDPVVTAAGRAGLPFVPRRWGNRPLGMLAGTLRDQHRLAEGRFLISLPRVNCLPEPAELASSVVLSRLPSRLGEHPARVTGEGAEFAGVREFVPGDRQRRINWPATTRLGALHLSTFAAERTQNLVVIADETADVGEPGSSSLDLVVRGSSGTIARYLANLDRVGLIIFATRLSWIGPGQGRRHFRRLVDLLMSNPGGWDRAANLTRLPRAALPPGALILVFSPLLDPRLVEALRDLRERGFNVLIVDVLNTAPDFPGNRISQLTTRIWQLEQQSIRFSLTQIGIPVVHWDGVSSLDEPLAPFTRRVMVVGR